MPKTYTVKQVADILGYSTNSIYTFLKEKRLKGVRVGKGRFRIPEEELRRVLHLSKKPMEPVHLESSQNSDAAVSVRPLFHEFVLPNIFDWFIGLSAVTSGLALFLFNATFVEQQFSTLSAILSGGRVILIASGIGIIASSIKRETWKWHKLFHAVLFFVGSINAVFLARAGDVDGAILYGSLALVIGLNALFHMGGLVAIGLYLSCISIFIPLGIFFAPNDIHFSMVAKFLGIPSGVLGVGVSVVSALFLTLYWAGLWRSSIIFVLAALGAAGFHVAAAIFYAGLQYWSRAFFMIVVGFFGLAAPLWRQVQETHSRRERILFHLAFGGIGAVLVVAIFVVALLQQNIWQQNTLEFFNKITAAQTTLTSAVDSVKSTMEMAGVNPDVIDAVGKNDENAMVRFGKILYESNPNIRRVVFLDRRGDGLALYPYGMFDQPNFAFREYFKKARDTKRAYVSNIFQALGDNAGRFVVVVAVPVTSQKGEFAGVMTASIDLDRLALRLGQLIVESRGEHFVIADSSNKILFHPQKERIGTDVPPNDLLLDAVSGGKDVVQGRLMDGTLGLIAYAPVPELGWGVRLAAPVEKVYTLTSSAVVTIVGLVGVLMVSAIGFLAIVRYRVFVGRGGGP